MTGSPTGAADRLKRERVHVGERGRKRTVICAATAHVLVRSSAPSRHTRCTQSSSTVWLRRLRRHGTPVASSAPSRRTDHCLLACAVTAHLGLAPFCAITAHHLSGPNTMLLLKLFQLFALCAITAHSPDALRHHGTLPLCRHSSPLSGPSTMLLTQTSPTCLCCAITAHLSFSSRRLRHHGTFVVVCTITAQLSFLIFSPGLPARP